MLRTDLPDGPSGPALTRLLRLTSASRLNPDLTQISRLTIVSGIFELFLERTRREWWNEEKEEGRRSRRPGTRSPWHNSQTQLRLQSGGDLNYSAFAYEALTVRIEVESKKSRAVVTAPLLALDSRWKKGNLERDRSLEWIWTAPHNPTIEHTGGRE